MQNWNDFDYQKSCENNTSGNMTNNDYQDEMIKKENSKNKIKNFFKKQDKKKLTTLGALVLGVLVLTVGFTYAIFQLTKLGNENTVLVAGDIYMHYTENNVLETENAVPRDTYDPNSYFEFTIDGKNEYKKPIWYDISLMYGDPVEGKKTRIADKYLRFRLDETKGDETTTIFDDKSYKDLSEIRVHVGKIEANTREEVDIKYKLYMWISSEVEVGNTETATYPTDVWNNDIYASIKVKVTGDFEEKELPKDTGGTSTLKEKADQPGEIVAVDSDGNKCTSIDSCEARDYRYSGTTVKNYVKLNNKGKDELWRIIGIFKDEDTDEEYLRIVRNEILPASYLPDTFVANETTYKIKQSGQNAYWNYITGTSSDKNDWSKAGLQYFLNMEEDSQGTKGYLNYLSAETKAMLRDEKYYLGSASADSGSYNDNSITAYERERAISGCAGGIGPSTNSSQSAIVGNETCSVWAGNAATWTGKVGLMYGSDYGFSTSSDQWTTNLYDLDGGGSDTSWMQTTMPDAGSTYSWLVSPSSYDSYLALHWNSYSGGYVYGGNVYYNNYGGVRPVLNLLSSVAIIAGEGTESNPYILE